MESEKKYFIEVEDLGCDTYKLRPITPNAAKANEYHICVEECDEESFTMHIKKRKEHNPLRQNSEYPNRISAREAIDEFFENGLSYRVADKLFGIERDTRGDVIIDKRHK
jgi:hypothetical protein